MNSLADPGALDALLARLAKLHDKRPRAWGKMTPHEMLCHLSDAFELALGERPFERRDTWKTRTIVRRIGLHSSFPWPRGLETMPEVKQGCGGTAPTDFNADRERLIALMRRFVRPEASLGAHPVLGPLTRAEWLTWGYRHTDHHLRQFAL